MFLHDVSTQLKRAQCCPVSCPAETSLTPGVGRRGRGWLGREISLLCGFLVTFTVRFQGRECFAKFSALIAGVGLTANCAGLMTELVSLQTALLGELLVTKVTREGLGKWERFVDHAVYI